MRKTQISGVVIGAMLALGLSTGPAFAVSADDLITVDGSACDLTDAGLGAGTASDPYLIGTQKQLAEINDCLISDYSYYNLTADIDLTPDASTPWNLPITNNVGGWTPIGNYDNTFQSYFNGKGHTISNLTIKSENQYQGLFGRTYTAVIKNLTINGTVEQTDGSDYTGAIVGDSDYLQLANITSDVDVITNADYAGGLIGRIDTGTVKNVVVNGDVTFNNFGNVNSYFGGVAGSSDTVTFDNIEVNGNVNTHNEDPNNAGRYSDATYVGGVAGEFYSGTLTNAVVNGNVSGYYYVGGMIGYGYYGALDHTVLNGDIFATNSYSLQECAYIGGVAGYWGYGSIANSAIRGDITIDVDDTDEDSNNQDAYYIGGIAGYYDYGSISDSAVEGDLTISADGTSEVYEVGGVVGYADYTGLVRITHSGAINAENVYQLGGIAGYLEAGGSLLRSSNTGDINVTNVIANGELKIGGLLGYADDGILVEGSFNSGDISIISVDDFSQVASLIGYTDDSVAIRDCYNRGDIGTSGSGEGDDVGAFIGYVDSEETEITNTYTTGSHPGADIATGNNGWWEPVDNYTSTYDTETTGRTSSVTGMIGHTTSEMKTESTFSDMGWSIGTDNSVWKIDPAVNDGYPYIQAAAPSDNGGSDNGGGESASAAVRDLLGPIAFKKGTAKITKASKLKLLAYASAIKAEDYDKVTVKVYTKSTNTKLSVKRAKAVVKFLKSKGVSTKLYKEAVTRSSKKKNGKSWIVAVKNATT